MTSYPILWLFAFIVCLSETSSAQLSADFYSKTCPGVSRIVQSVVFNEVKSDPRTAASLLRVHFHDCFVHGCDGSVLLDDTENQKGEKTSAPNLKSARKFDVIDKVKNMVEGVCPGVVSCADILTLAARDSVVALRGPSWNVALGRRDSLNASLLSSNRNIPGPSSNLNVLISMFQKKGLSAKDLVALSGAHTIGMARCKTFRNHIYKDTNINAGFAKMMQMSCPKTGGDDKLQQLDTATANQFDNRYYKNVANQKVLLNSDQQLMSSKATAALVQIYGTDQQAFFNDFANAMVKMGNISPLTGTRGEIRTNCRKAN